MPIVRILRQIVREFALLPRAVKVFIGLMIVINFFVITQWQHLVLETLWARFFHKQSHVIATSDSTSARQQIEQRPPNISSVPTSNGTQTDVEALRIKRIGRLIIADPEAQPNGSITGNGQTLYLYGIKQFDRKKLCTRASGEPWACGLHAYATLRNMIAHKTIICDPKKFLPNGIGAICHIGATDIALALIRDGLVEVDDKSELAELATAQADAKRRKLGIWDR